MSGIKFEVLDKAHEFLLKTSVYKQRVEKCLVNFYRVPLHVLSWYTFLCVSMGKVLQRANNKKEGWFRIKRDKKGRFTV